MCELLRSPGFGWAPPRAAFPRPCGCGRRASRRRRAALKPHNRPQKHEERGLAGASAAAGGGCRRRSQEAAGRQRRKPTTTNTMSITRSTRTPPNQALQVCSYSTIFCISQILSSALKITEN